MVKDIISGPDDQKGSAPAGLTAFGGKIIFSADDGVHGREPWLSDGTEQGTQLMVDLKQGPVGSFPVGFTPFGTKVLFFVGSGLWVTDGTDSGTTKLKSFDQVKLNRNVNSMVNAGGCLLFEAQSGSEERGLWRTDGTLGGTRFLKEVTIASPIAVVSQPTAPASTKP